MFPLNWREARVERQYLNMWDYFYTQRSEDTEDKGTLIEYLKREGYKSIEEVNHMISLMN